MSHPNGKIIPMKEKWWLREDYWRRIEEKFPGNKLYELPEKVKLSEYLSWSHLVADENVSHKVWLILYRLYSGKTTQLKHN